MPKRRSRHAHGPSEIWSRDETLTAIADARTQIAARLRALRTEAGLTQEELAERAGIHSKHLQRIERGVENATVGTLAAIALGLQQPLDRLFTDPADVPFQRVGKGLRPYKNAIPLYSLEAAAGLFSAAQEIEAEGHPEAWVAPRTQTKLAKGLFVASVVGESMNRRIPNGVFCLFRALVEKPRDGQVLLVQHHDLRDAEHGGRYTVKVFRRRALKHGAKKQAVLEPDSTDPKFEPIALPNDQAWRAIAELVEVLGSA